MIRESLLISKAIDVQLSYQQKAVEKRFNVSTAFSPYHI